MNILILAPHPDDECIGCGGAVCWHLSHGDRAMAVFLTSGELGLKQLPPGQARKTREQEARAAGRILGLAAVEFLRQPDWMLGEHQAEAARALRPVLDREKPDLVYLPHPNDWHPDHRAALPVLRAAWRRVRAPKPQLLFYEVWNPLPEHDCVRDVSPFMARKCRALRAHRSQLREFNYERAVRGLNQFRGALAGKCRYAEVFQSATL